MWLEICLVILSLCLLWKGLKRPAQYPPGLWGVPLIGYIPLGLKDSNWLFNLNKQFGDIVSWRIGSQVMVIIYDFDLIREAFSGTQITSRPDFQFFSLLNHNRNLGIVSSNGLHWHTIRRFTMRHLRDLGMGKSRLSSAVQHEAMAFVNDLKKLDGKPSTMPDSLIVSVLNVVWQLVASQRHSLDDPQIREFHHLIGDIQTNTGLMMIPEFFTFLNFVLPKYWKAKIFKENIRTNLSDKLTEYLKVSIECHKTTLDESNTRDFIDAYLIEMETKKHDPESTMSMDDLLFCMADLFGAGTETTTNTLHWAVFYMAHFEQVQKRLQKEMDDVIPRGDLVSYEDRAKLPYLESFIHEVLRFSSFAVFGGIHMASTDTTLGGYLIPKNAIVCGVSLSSHYDPRYFRNPETFEPERFLDSNRNFKSPKQGFLPFGIGRRHCLGESLARMEIFIFLSTMIQNLNFSAPPNKTIDLSPMEGNPFARMPKVEQEILITIRS